MTEHVVATRDYWGECRHCGAKLDWLHADGWTPIDVVLKGMDHFERRHAHCPRPAATVVTGRTDDDG